jgi:hypothetical protein
MEIASEPPPPLPPQTERREFTQARLFEELAIRDRLNRETEEHIEEFLAAIRDDLYYDPAFAEYFIRSQQRIDELKAKVARVHAGEVTAQDIEDTKARVSAVIGLIHDQPDSLYRQITLLEQKTQALVTKTLPAAIATYERELLQNRAARRRLQETSGTP